MSSGLGEFLTYPQSFLLGQRRLFFLLRLLLQLVVAHGDDGEDQVDQVERAQEDDQEKEDNVPRSCRPEIWKNVFIYFFNLENGQTEMIVMMVGRQWKTIKGGRMKRKNDK